jgi:hypothetical protein
LGLGHPASRAPARNHVHASQHPHFTPPRNVVRRIGLRCIALVSLNRSLIRSKKYDVAVFDKQKLFLDPSTPSPAADK